MQESIGIKALEGRKSAVPVFNRGCDGSFLGRKSQETTNEGFGSREATAEPARRDHAKSRCRRPEIVGL